LRGASARGEIRPAVPSGVPTPPPAIQPDQLDAQRYRWLKRYAPGESVRAMRGGEGLVLVGNCLDAEIDAAMAASSAGALPSGEVGNG
jgi:hypothetical protein